MTKTMSSIHVDDSALPLIVVTFEGSVDDHEFERYLARLDALWKRKARSAIVLDATRAARTPATQRRRQAEWMKVNDELLRTYSAGTAFVISSPLVRGGLTAILWLQPIPTAYVVVATRPEAERWARAQLQTSAKGAA
jgi:hypothetical protein